MVEPRGFEPLTFSLRMGGTKCEISGRIGYGRKWPEGMAIRAGFVLLPELLVARLFFNPMAQAFHFLTLLENYPRGCSSHF